MQEATMADMNMAMGGGNNPDDALFVRIFMKSRENQAKTKEAGRPIFEDIPYIEIRPPGEKDNIVVKPLDAKLRQRFPRHVQAFEMRQEEILVEGTPLDQWPGITRSQADELAFFKVFTVEQLVGMADSNVSGFMGLSTLKEKAKAYLEDADANAAKQALAEAKAENEQLRRDMQEMAIRLSALEDKPKRRRTKKDDSDDREDEEEG